MKIIHLSDLHLGYESLWAKKSTIERFEKIIRRLIFLKEPNNEYVIVITGDTVDNAYKEGIYVYEQAKEAIDRLVKSGFPVLIIPGNHDDCNGIYGNSKFVKKFKDVFFGNSDIGYPKLNILTFQDADKDGKRDTVAFIGLDSMAEELHWYDALFAQGELGKNQLKRLEDLLCENEEVKECSKRVVYLHYHPFHPYPGHALKDSKEFQNVLSKSKNVDVILFGHNHKGENFNGKLGIPRCYDGGSSTRKGKKTAAIRVMNLYKDPRTDYIMDIITESDL